MDRIDQVAGIGHKDATKLRKAGVKTSKALIEKGSTGRGRSEITATTGISQRQLLVWVNHAELLRVRGVGGEYSELLVAAGVDTVRDLRRRNPTALLAKIIGLNGADRVVARLPTEAMVESWIDSSASIEPSI